jgi:cytochrome c oxidase subunit 1
MLATTLSLVMLGFGGAGGLINMSYRLDATAHSTPWITGHFHLIRRAGQRGDGPVRGEYE